LSVGDRVGVEVGDNEGGNVGLGVGEFEGGNVGLDVGATVGNIGLEVGATVGPQVSEKSTVTLRNWSKKPPSMR